MSPQNASLGKVIDPFRFAAEARTQSGEVEVAKLPRLKDSLANVNAVLSWRLEGWLESSVLSGREEPRLKLLIDGALSLRCQRCLNGIDWQLAIATVLQPVRAGQQIPDEELEDDEVDAIEVEEGLDVMNRLSLRVRRCEAAIAQTRRINLYQEFFNGRPAEQEVPFEAWHAPCT